MVLRGIKRSRLGRNTAAVVAGALLWLAGPYQVGLAATDEVRAREERQAGKVRVLSLAEQRAIRGRASWPGNPRPWQYSVPTLGGYGQLNCSSGNHLVTIPVVAWSGKGGGLTFNLYHNSASAGGFSYFPSPPIAARWSHSYHVYLTGAGTSTVTVVEGDGSSNAFSQNVDGSFTAPAGVWDTLVQNGNGTYTVTRKYGTQLNFGANNKLASIVDTNGNTTTLQYGTNGHVSSITDATNRTLTLGYAGNGLLQTITDPLSRVFTLSYTFGYSLQRVTFPAPAVGQPQPYFEFGTGTHMGANVLSSFRNRRGSTWTIAYQSNDPGTPSQIVDPLTHTLTFGGGSGMGQVTLENGSTYSFQSDTSGNRISVSLGGNPVWPVETQSWTWDSQHNMLTRVTGTGGVWEYTYDARGNVLTAEDPITRTNPSVTIQQTTYNSQNLPTSTWDALNHRTDFY